MDQTGQAVNNQSSTNNPEVELKKNNPIYRVRQASFLFPSDRSVQKRKLACHTLYYQKHKQNTKIKKEYNNKGNT
jgi:hypothetical protein